MRKQYLTVKRILDFIAALFLLVFLLPILVAIALAIKLETKGSVIFKQDRLGLNGKVFKIYKFRSMVVNAEKHGSGVYSYKGDPRVTKVGAILRRTSIDELPQLSNIVKGEMSFIGPRPTLVHHPWPLEEYSNSQKKRFTVRPGVTGLAQINGRKEVPWVTRMLLDVKYVNDVSLMLDIKILFITAIKVFSMENNYNTQKTVDAAATVSHNKGIE